ncbi:hypothetical protein [Brucella sp. SA075A]|uniref:hypothetical protein n=1 Tax=Brucella sp. SA075A TaxID=3121521 RepID=UPI003B97F2BC
MSKPALRERYNTRYQLKRPRKGVAGSFVAGLATLLTLAGPNTVSANPRNVSASKSLRGDFVRLGADLRGVIAKERRREETGR